MLVVYYFHSKHGYVAGVAIWVRMSCSNTRSTRAGLQISGKESFNICTERQGATEIKVVLGL